MPESAALFFGKLPNYGDFVRFNASGPDVRALDQWLQECLYLAGRFFASQWSAVYRNAPAYYFVFHSDHTETALTGILQPSYDKSNRKYPFILAHRINKKYIEARMIPLVPMMLASLFQDSRKIVEEGLNGLPSSDISNRTEGLAAASFQNYESHLGNFEAYLRSTTTGQFWSRHFGEFTDPRKYLLIKNLNDVFKLWASGRPVRTNLGVRFPLSQGDVFHHAEVSFWTLLGCRILGGLSALPNMFWGAPPTSGKAYFYLFLDRPSAKSFIPLVQPATESDTICRLDEDGLGDIGEAARRLPQKHRIALESESLTLRDFADTFEEGGSRADGT
jgi:type VI secretion system ImpM family protein